MSGYFEEPLKSRQRPQIDDVMATGGDSDSSEGIAALIEQTRPERIAEAGRNYQEIARLCEASVAELSTQAQAIANTMGGESLHGVFEKIGELQKDLARIHVAATSVGRPLQWYGEQVLPWFKRNVPRTGGTSIDDDLFDTFGSVEDNAHVIARHHLRLLNAYMGDVYGAMTDYLEQSAKAPQTGMVDPSIGSPGGFKMPGLGGVGDPYAGLGSPYGTPNIPGMDGSRPRLDTPGLNPPNLQDPNLQNPGLQNPSPRDPSLQNPSLPNPNLPGQTPPDYKAPDFKTPEVPATPRTPTNLAELPQTTVPNPAAPGNPGGPATQTPPGNPGGPGSSYGAGAATQLAGAGSAGGARGGMPGMGMGMVPPMMGGGQGGQERDRDRTRFPLLEDEAFETDDMGGPSVIA
jgi:hypothetical protein